MIYLDKFKQMDYGIAIDNGNIDEILPYLFLIMNLYLRDITLEQIYKSRVHYSVVKHPVNLFSTYPIIHTYLCRLIICLTKISSHESRTHRTHFLSLSYRAELESLPSNLILQNLSAENYLCLMIDLKKVNFI